MRRRSAAIAGAGGLVGRCCLEALLAEDRYSRITALVRKPVDVAHSKLIQRIVNFERIVPPGDLAEGVAFCALGATIRKAGTQEAFRRVDFDYAVSFAEWARQAGASRFVLVSSVDASSRSRSFYLRVKGEVEDRISHMGFEAVHIMRPSFLMGARAERRWGEWLGITAFHAVRFALTGRLSQYRPVEARAVAQAMVRAGLLDVTGPHLWHWKQIVDAGGL